MYQPDHGGDAWDASSRLKIPVTGILDFSANVNPLGTSPLAAEAIQGGIQFLNFYPDRDCSRLKEAIASYIRGVSSENILVGNGSTEIIHLFAQVFLETGDEAIILQPTFSEYEYAILRNDAKPVMSPMGRGFKLDAGTLLKSVTPKTRAIFLCNPNNPTSTTLDGRGVKEIVEEAAKRRIMVLLDECFIEFVDDCERMSLSRYSKDHGNLLVLRSLTKVFGLAGLRVGYAIGEDKTITLLDRAKVTWSVNTLAQIAGVAALNDAEYLNATRRLIRKERTYLSESLPRVGVAVTPPEANFLLADLQGLTTAPEVKRRLLTHRILIRDCSGFRGLGPSFVRFAVRKRRDNVALLRALRDVLRN
jgi:threonine-phosphate decarboxylase